MGFWDFLFGSEPENETKGRYYAGRAAGQLRASGKNYAAHQGSSGWGLKPLDGSARGGCIFSFRRSSMSMKLPETGASGSRQKKVRLPRYDR